MDKSTVLLIVLLLLVILFGAMVLLIKQYIDHSVRGKNGNAKASREGVYFAEDALALGEWLGKTADETGVDESYFTERYGFFVVAFEGLFCGKAANGSVYFSADDTDAVMRGSTVYIHTPEADFDECKATLDALYGEATDEAELPYAEANGGAVRRCSYESGALCIALSRASERDYTEITLRKKEADKD